MSNQSYSNRNEFHQLFRSFNSFNNQLSKLQTSFSQLSSCVNEFETNSSSSTNSKRALEDMIQWRNKTINDLKGIKSATDFLRNQSHDILKRAPKKGSTNVRGSLQGWYGNISGQCIKLQDQIDHLIADIEAKNITTDLAKGDKTIESLGKMLGKFSKMSKSKIEMQKTMNEIRTPSGTEFSHPSGSSGQMIDPILPLIAVLIAAAMAAVSKSKTDN